MLDAKIPDDRTSISSWDGIVDEVDAELIRALKSDTSLWECATRDRGIADQALRELMAIADRVVDGPDHSRALGQLHAAGVDALFSAGLVPSSRPGEDRYVLYLGEGGIGLPTGSYYSSEGRGGYARRYTAHIHAVMQRVAGVQDPRAAEAFGVEHEVCQSELSPAEVQDVTKTNNWVPFASLPAGLNWVEYAAGLGVATPPADVNVECLRSLRKGAALVARRSPGLRAYLHWRCADLLASQMGPLAEDLQFQFYGALLGGQRSDRLLEKRRCDAMAQLLPEYVGAAFIALRPQEHAANKEAAIALVKCVTDQLGASFEASEVLPADVKVEWREKLRGLTFKVGYPSGGMSPDGAAALEVARKAVAAGAQWPSVVLAIARARRARNMGRVGQPVDRERWTDMQPHTVNACFVAETNQIVIPAAVLRRPLFGASEGDAFNMGGLGAVVGHELTHGFDPNGMRFDSHGKLVGHANVIWYQAMSGVVNRQASREGVNAELTSGENVADQAGLCVAHLALANTPAYQRADARARIAMDRTFFTRWATVWATKMTDAEAKRRLLVDPHAPARMRCNNPVRNIEAFGIAFGAGSGDAMYLEPSERASMWFDDAMHPSIKALRETRARMHQGGSAQLAGNSHGS